MMKQICTNVVILPSVVGRISKNPFSLYTRHEPTIMTSSLIKTKETNHRGIEKSGELINANAVKQLKSNNLSAKASKHAPKNVFTFHQRASAPSIKSVHAAIKKR